MTTNTRRKPGRPPLFKEAGAQYLTVKLSRRTLATVNRLAGAAPGRKAATVRSLIDAGIAARRKH